MSCTLNETMLHGYFDGELDAVRASEFESHLESCAECQATLENMEFLRARLRKSDLYEHASAELRSKIEKELNLSRPRPFMTGLFFRPRFWMPAFAVLSLILAFSVVFLLLSSRQQSEQITAELIDAHVRSLQPGHLEDVQSSDQHTVKPWFDGKLDFVPPVTDYAEQGFPLLGGRLDIINGHSVAALVYGRRKHIINVFVWPYHEKEPPVVSSGSRQGYNWLTWQSGDMAFCAISDAATTNLQELKSLFQP